MNQVRKLIKYLYGIKHTSRQWYKKLASLTIHQVYKHATLYHSLFDKRKYSSFTIFIVYVDDVILTNNSISEFQHMRNDLHQEFKIKDLDTLKYFLSLEVAHSK